MSETPKENSKAKEDEVPAWKIQAWANCLKSTDGLGPASGPGVYAVCVRNTVNSKERIIYIGSSTNIKKRVLNPNHPYILAYRKFEDKLVYIKDFVCDNYIEVEKALIAHLRPLLNKTHKK